MKKIMLSAGIGIILVGIGLFLTHQTKTESRLHRPEPQKTSLYDAECLKYGLNPETARPFDVECAKFGLDPKKTSLFQLTCIENGFDPDSTSLKELQGYPPRRH